MARYKHYGYNQAKMIPLRFEDQVEPGTFEYTLNHVVDSSLDQSLLESRNRNDHNGAPTYDPSQFLKIVPFYYPLKSQCLPNPNQQEGEHIYIQQ